MTRTTRAQRTMRHTTTMTHPYLRPETHVQVFAPTAFLAASGGAVFSPGDIEQGGGTGSDPENDL